MENKNYTFRYIIVGDSGVGKTSILHRFEKNQFDTKVMSTIGIDYVRKNLQINQDNITIQVWDTAGQENINCCAVILVYDITNRRTFENIDNWLKNVEENVNSYSKKILVGNKQDKELDRVISTNEGKAFAETYKMQFIETSARTSYNVSTIFDQLTQKIYSDLQMGRIQADQEGEHGIKIHKNDNLKSSIFNLRDEQNNYRHKKEKKCCNQLYFSYSLQQNLNWESKYTKYYLLTYFNSFEFFEAQNHFKNVQYINFVYQE